MIAQGSLFGSAILFVATALTAESAITQLRPDQRLEAIKVARAETGAGPVAMLKLTEILNVFDLSNNPHLRLEKIDTESPLFLDPAFNRNVVHLVRNFDTFVIGGEPVKANAFKDTVVVGSEGRWCCSGVLIAPNAVLTAGHCAAGCASRVGLGTNVNHLTETLRVLKTNQHTNYNAGNDANDLAILILDRSLWNIEFAVCATKEEVDNAPGLRLVAFGHTNTTGSAGAGIKRFVDIPTIPGTCSTPDHTAKYRCHVDKEIVAGKPLLQRDQCKEDSGGPVYVVDGSKLAGIASRSLISTNRCGDGGIYVRVHPYRDWISAILAKYPP